MLLNNSPLFECKLEMASFLMCRQTCPRTALYDHLTASDVTSIARNVDIFHQQLK